MAKSVKNIASSVHQRLLNKAKESSRPFNELLQYFAIERFIYRLSKSPHADKFILKGALMFSAWCGPASRPTMESTIAEKFQATVKLGVLNSRMKDFYDIWVLSGTFDFKGEILAKAIEKTFEKRNTPVNLDAALFDPSFGKDGNKNVQWQGS